MRDTLATADTCLPQGHYMYSVLIGDLGNAMAAQGTDPVTPVHGGCRAMSKPAENVAASRIMTSIKGQGFAYDPVSTCWYRFNGIFMEKTTPGIINGTIKSALETEIPKGFGRAYLEHVRRFLAIPVPEDGSWSRFPEGPVPGGDEGGQQGRKPGHRAAICALIEPSRGPSLRFRPALNPGHSEFESLFVSGSLPPRPSLPVCIA